MNYYATVNRDSGALLDLSEFAPVVEYPLQTVTLDHWPDVTKERWNPSTLVFEPKPVRLLSHLDFLDRLTAQEYATIKAACAANVTLDFEWQKFFSAQWIDLDDARTIYGIQMLESVGLIATGRAAEILA